MWFDTLSRLQSSDGNTLCLMDGGQGASFWYHLQPRILLTGPVAGTVFLVWFGISSGLKALGRRRLHMGEKALSDVREFLGTTKED